MPWPAEASRVPARHLRALVSCNAVSEELPLVVDGSRRPSPAMAEHLQTCLRCQAELAGYRRLLRVLRNLRDEPVAFPAPALVNEALRAVQGHIDAFGNNPAPHDRRGATYWWLAGSVAAVGVAALWAGAAMARATRQHRAAVTA